MLMIGGQTAAVGENKLKEKRRNEEIGMVASTRRGSEEREDAQTD